MYIAVKALRWVWLSRMALWTGGTDIWPKGPVRVKNLREAKWPYSEYTVCRAEGSSGHSLVGSVYRTVLWEVMPSWVLKEKVLKIPHRCEGGQPVQAKAWGYNPPESYSDVLEDLYG